MSSRFVSAGVIDAATGEAAAQNTSPATTTGTATNSRKQAEWAAVTAQLDSDRRQREAARQSAASAGGQPEKSLYEVLQANKAAKQAAFEEAHRLRNQFRALDDDEVAFLEEVRERKRREEEEGRREVERGLEVFKAAQRKGLGSAVGEGEGALEVEEEEDIGFAFGGGKRRRREVGGERKRLKGVAGLKRASTGGGSEGEGDGKGGQKESKEKEKEEENGKRKETGDKGEASKAEGLKPAAPAPAPATSTAKSGGLLVEYGSSDDED